MDELSQIESVIIPIIAFLVGVVMGLIIGWRMQKWIEK